MAYFRFFLLCTAVLIISIFFASTTYSANLSTAMLRLNKLTANTALSGLVCATPATSATEGKVQVSFPSDFSISSSGWSTSTSDIPSGSTAWPGISYSSVSSTTVTFNSSDLSVGTRYCFNFTASGSTTGATGQKTATITTLTSGNSSIDTKEIGLTIKTSDTVNVNATVPASASDFTATLTKTSPTSNTFSPNQTVSYSLEYESLLSYATNVEVVASWTQGTIAGSGTPSLDIADYVIGSASNGYGSTSPVIDTVNRTITWSISSFPGSTPSTVTFELETTEAYTGSEQVSFTVNGVLEGPGTQSTTSSITSYYQYTSAPTSTPTNGPGPTATPGPGPTATPGPPQTTQVTFDTVEIDTLTANTAQIFTSLNSAVPATIYYGTSLSSLNKSIKSPINSTSHIFKLTDLISNTQYFFKVTAGNGSISTTSDIFTFTTALASDAPSIELDSVVIESNNVLLLDPLTADGKNKRIAVVPSGSSFQIKFKVDKKYEVKRIQTFLQPKNVLGINTFARPAEAVGFNTNMIPVGRNEYAGRLFSGSTPGLYQVFAKIYDTNGNIVEEKVLEIKVAKRFKVTNYKKDPIEGAELLLYYFDKTEKRYVIISSQALSIQNPSFSDFNGEFNVTLPQGEYLANITAIGFKEKELKFSIGPKANQDYPQVILESTPFTFLSFFTYYFSTFVDFTYAFILTLTPLSYSYRFVDLTAFFITLTFVLLTFTAFVLRTKLHLSTIHHFFALNTPFIKNKIKYPMQLKLLDPITHKPVSEAEVFVESKDKQIILSTKSQKNGMVYLVLPPSTSEVGIVKTGYEELSMSVQEALDTHEVTLAVKETVSFSIIHTIRNIIHSFFALFFEVFLIASFLFEAFFFITWSPIKILPFFILSILNLWLWIKCKYAVHKFI